MHPLDSCQTWNPRPDSLARDLQMPLARHNNLRTTILLISGITETECHVESDLRGPLDELKAANMIAGPFKLGLTTNPTEHLTFVGTHSKTTVLLLDTESIFNLYAVQRIGLARYVSNWSPRNTSSAAGIPSFFIELLYSHVLFFARDKVSENLGDLLGLDMDMIREFRDEFSPMRSEFQLQNFPIARL